VFDTGCVEGWRAEQQRQQTNGWSPGEAILNDTGARKPEHTFHQPVPIVARIVWEDDGEEFIDTVAGGWRAERVRAATGPEVSAHVGVAGGSGRQAAIVKPFPMARTERSAKGPGDPLQDPLRFGGV
jgi:hypothetical protein